MLLYYPFAIYCLINLLAQLYICRRRSHYPSIAFLFIRYFHSHYPSMAFLFICYSSACPVIHMPSTIQTVLSYPFEIYWLIHLQSQLYICPSPIHIIHPWLPYSFVITYSSAFHSSSHALHPCSCCYPLSISHHPFLFFIINLLLVI